MAVGWLLKMWRGGEIKDWRLKFNYFPLFVSSRLQTFLDSLAAQKTGIFLWKTTELVLHTSFHRVEHAVDAFPPTLNLFTLSSATTEQPQERLSAFPSLFKCLDWCRNGNVSFRNCNRHFISNPALMQQFLLLIRRLLSVMSSDTF